MHDPNDPYGPIIQTGRSRRASTRAPKAMAWVQSLPWWQLPPW